MHSASKTIQCLSSLQGIILSTEDGILTDDAITNLVKLMLDCMRRHKNNLRIQNCCIWMLSKTMILKKAVRFFLPTFFI